MPTVTTLDFWLSGWGEGAPPVPPTVKRYPYRSPANRVHGYSMPFSFKLNTVGWLVKGFQEKLSSNGFPYKSLRENLRVEGIVYEPQLLTTINVQGKKSVKLIKILLSLEGE